MAFNDSAAILKYPSTLVRNLKFSTVFFAELFRFQEFFQEDTVFFLRISECGTHEYKDDFCLLGNGLKLKLKLCSKYFK